MKYLQFYIIVLAISALLCFFTGVFMILRTSTIRETVSKEWPEISQRLKDSGYDIGESTFSNFLEVNVKFGGLFVIVFCLFLVVGFIPAYYLRFLIKKKGEVQTVGLGGGTGVFGTPYRLNSDNTSPKLRKNSQDYSEA